MTKHNLIHLFPELDCASHPSHVPSCVPGNEARALPEGESSDNGPDSGPDSGPDNGPDNGIIRAGLLYMASDLSELAKIASMARARELRAMSQLMRALAAS